MEHRWCGGGSLRDLTTGVGGITEGNGGTGEVSQHLTNSHRPAGDGEGLRAHDDVTEVL